MVANGKRPDSEKFSFGSRLRSFKSAFSGLKQILRHEHNFRIHLSFLIIVIVGGIYFRITTGEWIAVAIVSALVLAAECFNSAIEYLADIVSPDTNPMIKKVKDSAAAGVLIVAIIAFITGLIIFIPEIIEKIDILLGK
jgi:diacylglycerol kinase (ATP)